MRNPADLHQEAMRLATLGATAQRRGSPQTARSYFARAFEHEREAALIFAPDHGTEPTRSVLLRSAATLALDCGELRESERLIAIALTGEPPDEIANELRDLYESVNFERHLRLQDTELEEDEVQMALEGSVVGYGIIPYTEIGPRIQTVDSLLTRSAERRHHHQFRERGRPAKEIADHYGVYVSVAMAASYAIKIRVGKPIRQKRMFREEPTGLITEFLDCLRLYQSDSDIALRRKIGTPAYYRNFVAQARKLSPDGKRIRAVGFTSIQDDNLRVVSLRPKVSGRWGRRVRRDRMEILVGELTRASKNEESNTIGIRIDNVENPISVRVPEGLMDDIVRPLWARLVRAECARMGGKLTLMNIRPVDEGSGPADVGEPPIDSFTLPF